MREDLYSPNGIEMNYGKDVQAVFRFFGQAATNHNQVFKLKGYRGYE